jgi:hypothetical protein
VRGAATPFPRAAIDGAGHLDHGRNEIRGLESMHFDELASLRRLMTTAVPPPMWPAETELRFRVGCDARRGDLSCEGLTDGR